MTDAKKVNRWKLELILIFVVLIATLLINIVFAAIPTGPSLVYVKNETSAASGIPTLENNANSKGGQIITLVLTARQQNPHYKAYVGNVTGAYVLEDASNYSIYEWSISTIAGEVYTTRASSTINWNNIVCANSSHVAQEMTVMRHNSTNTPDDPMNKTFDDDANDHWGFWVGGSDITPNSCNYSINTWVNDTAQSSTNLFDEVVLYDGGGDIIYATKIENDLRGYRNDSTTYDFQMLVAENASDGGPYQTNYYFYVELS